MNIMATAYESFANLWGAGAHNFQPFLVAVEVPTSLLQAFYSGSVLAGRYTCCYHEPGGRISSRLCSPRT
jgi:hypothetical protein